MKRAGVQKPPLAPKPSVKPAAVQTELASRLFAYQQRSSPAVEQKEKPAVAPKPCLSNIPPHAFNSKPLKVEHQARLQQKPDATRNVGLLNIRNGTHVEVWDYVIPICVCNDGNCADCVASKDNNHKVLQHERCPGTKEVARKTLSTPTLSKSFSGYGSSNNNNNSQQHEKPQIQNSDYSKANQSIIPKWKNIEMPASRIQQNIGSGITSPVDSMPTPKLYECRISREDVHRSQYPDEMQPLRKPVAVLRKAKMEQPNGVRQESMGPTRSRTGSPVDLNNTDVFMREVNITKVGHTSESKGTRDFKENQNDRWVTPIPTPRQKIPRLQQNKTQDARQSVSTRGTEVKAQNLDVHVDGNQYPIWRRVPPKPRPDFGNIGTTEHSVDGLLNKTNMIRSPMPEIKNEDCVVITDAEVKPPANPKGNVTPSKNPRVNLKPKSRSLSSVDLLRPDGVKKSSFLKIVHLDFSDKKVPTKNRQDLDFPTVRNEQSVDAEFYSEEIQNQVPPERPMLNGHADRIKNWNNREIEQSVDGDDLDIHVDDEHVYDDVAEYEYLPHLSTTQVEVTNTCQNQTVMYENDGFYDYPDVIFENPTNSKKQQELLQSMYEDDGLYEYPEVYSQNPTDSEQQELHQRNALDEMDEFNDTHSEEDESSLEEDEDNPTIIERRIDAKKNKVEHIVNEIMTSEKIFVSVLKLLHIDFREAVLKASCQTGKAVIDERVLNQILCSLPTLYELNCNLLKELEKRVAHWNEHCAVADIFVKKGPYLKMYSTYIREFDKNVALLEEQCRKNPAFAKVVREFESDPCCANLAVKHYMLKPIQRIPQYQLLLTAYLNHLDEDSPDYKNAEAALVIVKEVANHANEIVRQEDNFQKLYEVQCRLVGQHVIVQPGRVLLKEGILMKSSRKVMQPRMFFLFNDGLLYSTPLPSGNYRVNNMLSLAEMKVSKRYQEDYYELNIESVERSFILSASSAVCRDQWLQAISTAIEDYNKDNSVKNPEMQVTQDVTDNDAQLGTKAPIWIPDQRATMCMICTCEFTLTWRRHHCRACGKVVCQACSSNKHPLKYLKNQHERVCDLCFAVLQRRNSGDQGPSNTALSPNGKSLHYKKGKKKPAALKEVSANMDGSSMNGYLERTKGNKKQWRRFWFVIMNKVLYTYAASEDVAALESQPLLGFSLKSVNPEALMQFQLYHKNTLYYIFKANDSQACQRWIEAFQEAMVL
ncbi:uncharacterized protein [Paramisgurnus dabryanus]|uniref:uncharacterized protein isoform X2 n=1 Tax=Paramisgurnus dabryanus TaxID=90735 RepID=UPI0031F3C289